MKPEIQGHIDAIREASEALAGITPISHPEQYEPKRQVLMQTCAKAVAYLVPALENADQLITDLHAECRRCDALIAEQAARIAQLLENNQAANPG